MKQALFILFVFFSISSFGQPGVVTRLSRDTVSTDYVTINYTRPLTNGRVIFGNMAKYGQVWRVGGPQSTITFSRSVLFGGETVPAGAYTLFVIPYESQWTIILNDETSQWGTYGYEKFKYRNVASISIAVTPLVTPVEQLTIRFPTSSLMLIEWSNVQVAVPVI